MHIHLNGKPHATEESQSIAGLMAELDLAGKRVAVEVNQEIVPASLHAKTTLYEGDAVEVVHAIGGG